jgi:hypothetical protein
MLSTSVGFGALPKDQYLDRRQHDTPDSQATGTRSTLMYSFRRRTRDAELSRLRAENAEMRSRIGRLVEEKAVLRDRLEEMSSFKRTPLPLPGTW